MTLNSVRQRFWHLAKIDTYFPHVASVWTKHFESEDALRLFFDSIKEDSEKDLFLRIGSFYRFLVVEGTFRFSRQEWDNGLSYIDETYKYIAIFSLIEALEISPNRFEFYQWLKKNKKGLFPITECELDEKYQDYKAKYGSIRAVVSFFSRLDKNEQDFIRQHLEVDNKPCSLKQLVQLLYDFRSKFVHQARFVLEFGPGTSICIAKNKVIVNNMKLQDIKRLFELGFKKRFECK